MNKWAVSLESKCRPTLFLAGCDTIFAEKDEQAYTRDVDGPQGIVSYPHPHAPGNLTDVHKPLTHVYKFLTNISKSLADVRKNPGKSDIVTVNAERQSGRHASCPAITGRDARHCVSRTGSHRIKFKTNINQFMMKRKDYILADDRPSALKSTARQHMRKQWLAPLRKPFSSCPRWASVNSGFFVFSIANHICYYRPQRKTKYFI
jgi:hypothetical protein